MGLPPRYLQTRRLITKYFKNRPIKNPDKNQANPITDLIKCWNLYGHDSIKCQPIQAKFDDFFENKDEFSKNLKKINFPQLIMGQLQKPFYKHQKKGKFKDIYTGPIKKHRNFFDGIN